MDRIKASFVKSSRNMFEFLKNSENIKEAFLKSISYENQFNLVPFSRFMLEDEELIKKLLEWRIKNKYFFFDEMEPTYETTLNWLNSEIISNPDRVLFLIFNKNGKIYGCAGLNIREFFENSIELDHLVILPEANYSEANKIIKTLVEWCKKIINVEKFYWRVFSNKKNRIQMFKKIGFEEIQMLDYSKNINLNSSQYTSYNSSRSKVLLFEYKNKLLDDKKQILTAGPSISQKEIFYVNNAVTNGWNKNHSRYLDLFQKKFSEILQVKYCIATSSCTGALIISLMALDIGEGDEVIIPDISWVAAGRAVQTVGAKPVFVDVLNSDWTMDTSKIENLINKNTKAIMPVHLYGMPCDMTEIVRLAKKHNLKIIEDAAPAIGATHKNKFCGSFGEFGAFSFQGAKLTVTGEGGMLVTNDLNLYEKAIKIWDFGRDVKRTFWIDQVGTKFKMSNIQAALGLGQIERLDEMIYMKRRIFKWYEEYLDHEKVNLIKENSSNFSIYWMSNITIESNKISRDNLILELKKKNIDSRPVFPSVSQYPIWESNQNLDISKIVARKGLNLPSGVSLEKNDIQRVCKEINRLI